MALQVGDPVSVAWKGATRYGVVTGARFIPVRMDDDGETYNVDTRVITLGYQS